MKKIISCVLLLTLCLGLFAGCTTTETNTGLDAAKEYLYTMYKDTNGTETTTNYTLVGVVTIVDVGTYNVTWTSSSDKITVAADGKMVNITVPEYTETKIDYTLTATIADDKGNTTTVSFNYSIPASPAISDGLTGTKVDTIADGDKVIIYYPDSKLVITDSVNGKKLEGAEAVVIGDKLNAAAGAVMDVKVDSNGYYTFLVDGKYLTSGATGNSLSLEASASEYSLWALDAAEGGYYIRSVNASYNDTKNQCLEYYSGFTTYGLNTTKANIYTFQFFKTTGSTISGSTGGNSSTPSNDPAADSTLTIADAIALGTSKAHDTYTTGKYYVTGKITEIYNTQYGNMKITDDAGNILTIYGTYSADGKDRFDAMSNQPKVGDTVTIYGIIGQYNNTPQIKNGWITSVT